MPFNIGDRVKIVRAIRNPGFVANMNERVGDDQVYTVQANEGPDHTETWYRLMDSDGRTITYVWPEGCLELVAHERYISVWERRDGRLVISTAGPYDFVREALRGYDPGRDHAYVAVYAIPLRAVAKKSEAGIERYDQVGHAQEV